MSFSFIMANNIVFVACHWAEESLICSDCVVPSVIKREAAVMIVMMALKGLVQFAVA